jgi:site-specific DNA-cytosine methylase
MSIRFAMGGGYSETSGLPHISGDTVVIGHGSPVRFDARFSVWFTVMCWRASTATARTESDHPRKPTREQPRDPDDRRLPLRRYRRTRSRLRAGRGSASPQPSRSTWPHCGVIHDRMPDTALFTDVRKVTADELRAAGFDPDNGVLLAGWPCQDLSVAGRRLGLGGARSGLFWEIIRLLADLRPRWFCLENVPGLLVGGLPLPRRRQNESAAATATQGTLFGEEPAATPPPSAVGCVELHGGAMGAVLGALAELGYGVRLPSAGRSTLRSTPATPSRRPCRMCWRLGRTCPGTA